MWVCGVCSMWITKTRVMKITLKNVQVNERLSKGSLAFRAILYINGQPMGILTNTGLGGETNYQALDKRGESLIREAVKRCGCFPLNADFDEGSDGRKEAGRYQDSVE